jgi:PfaB family protein
MESIAIVGLSCLFPGAQTPEQYWQNLIEQTDLTSLATIEQIGVNPDLFYDPHKGKPDKFYCQRGGYIRDFQFDATGYQVAADLLNHLDPMHQWALYAAKQALQASGYFNNSSILADCGVILGNLSFPIRRSHPLFAEIYHKALTPSLQALLHSQTFQLDRAETADPDSRINGHLSGYPSALIAQALALSGVNLSLDAACASSLYAIKLACHYLQAGRANLMLAGAVSAADPLSIHMGFSIFQAYPENDRTAPLDRSSQGLIAGEGASMVVLKRHADAVRDRDRIYAVIRGIGLSNDGKGKFVLSPNPKGQTLAFERAYADANIPPNSIEYIECHATGTPLGDLTELNSLDAFFGNTTPLPLIGSVKSNFGHLLTAAGMASLLKVILSMNNGSIPATLKISQPLSSERGRFGDRQIVRSLTPWTTATKRAAVNAFGFGGTNAHLILESHPDPQLASEDLPQHSQIPLAIVGMDAHFGDYDGLAAFDRAIYAGAQSLKPVPPARWQGIEADRQLLQDYGFTTGTAPDGAYIQDFEFDFLRFKLPPLQEDRLIPQQLLALKIADRAIQNSGLQPGGNVAVIVAMGTELAVHQFRGRCDLSWQLQQSLAKAGISLSEARQIELERLTQDSLHPAAQLNQYTSFIGNLIASRIAALWDFSGPAFTLSAEETSTFRALEVAQLMLAAGEVDAVVIGAIDLAGSFENVFLRQQQHPVNSGSRSLSFDVDVNGWTIGEGAGAIIVKTQTAAQQQGDRIYATIAALSLVQAHVSPAELSELPIPATPTSVTQACQSALTIANLQPSDIGYLEVFGSGIAQIDEAEITGLLAAYPTVNSQLTCGIGSVKANVGHTFAAAGMASLIKTALCLYHRYIPAVPEWTAPKYPELWQQSPFYVATNSKFWFVSPSHPNRIAAINSVGIDGTYAHLILSEPTPTPSADRPNTHLTHTPFYLFPIAAGNAPELRSSLDRLRHTIAQTPSLLAAASQTYDRFQATVAASDHNPEDRSPYRLAIVGHTHEEVLREIEFAVEGINTAFECGKDWKTPLGSYFTPQPLARQGQIAFVYPGMGSSDIGRGRDLFRLFPQLDDRFASLTSQVSQAMQEQLLYPRSLEQPSPLTQSEHLTNFLGNGAAMCQSGISLAVLHTLILREYCQIQPQAACGYSLGAASSMLFALGVWRDDRNLCQTLDTSPLFKTELCGACTVARQAWQVPQERSQFWQSYVLKATVSEVRAALHQSIPALHRVYITFVNTPQELVIAGDPQECLHIIAQLKCQSFPVNFNSILHSPLAKSRERELVELHQIPVHPVSKIRFYTGVTPTLLVLEQNQIAHNSARICCQPVDFPATIDRVYDDGVRIFIELGAGNACTNWIRATLATKPHTAVSIDLKGVDDRTGILRLCAHLIGHGVDLNLTQFYPAPPIELPLRLSSIATVTLGGSRIADTLLTAQNYHRFQTMNEPDRDLQTLRIIQLQIANDRGAESSSDLAAVRSTADLYPQLMSQTTQPKQAIWDEADLLEFARGSIAKVFGADYTIIDSYARRVRLPMPPYLLVSRVTQLDAHCGQFQPCSLTTEFDIPANARYSVDGQISWAVAVESGQCDLLLISYLGIDFENQGNLVYRLLDCTLTFLADLPKEGETLRYDIKINSFVRNGSNLLFFFSYECFVGENMVLKMDRGCAGFFTDEQLAQGKGVIFSAKELRLPSQIHKQQFEPLLICQKSKFDRTDLLHLGSGNLAACFGNHYWQGTRNPSLRLPHSDFLMLDRIVSIDPNGGNWGLGLIVGEQQLHPDDWYFPCHFKDDRVMAGSLMAEGCGQLLQVYMLYLGLQTCTTNARFQPIPGLGQVVRCRGQVTPMSAVLTYRMEITAIGFNPQPFVRCNVAIILHDKTIVHFQDLGLQLCEKSPQPSLDPAQLAALAPRLADRPRQPALLNEDRITEFCTGELAKCFGPEYAIYDRGTVKASRMPNTHLNLVHRILSVEGQRYQIAKGSAIVTEYDVPLDPWYYRHNSSPTIPYAILMELALQPCGFLSAYLGTTLMFPELSLYFRNLDGKGHLLKLFDLRGKTITNRSQLLSSIDIQGTIIQSFEFQMHCDGELFYEGTSSFGHFSPEVLVNQVGLDRGQYVRPWYETDLTAGQTAIDITLRSPDNQHKFYRSSDPDSQYRLANYQLDLLDEVKIIPGGGNHQQGYIYATKQVQPNDWYFKCHFQDDPVMPGSLGIEAMLQALQVYVLQLDLGKHLKSPSFKATTDIITTWKYRGQIPQGQTEMTLEIHLTQVEITSDRVTISGDASLWKPGLRIYEVKNLSITLT